ncbi:MAG: cob(I)yrinic acid a,c-diamide adenosyltransferase, partial [Endomicrobium sp.]|jgi:cob(I)alamin adenosyltransferase|nr:cob(I)yrinic acid a,c-diamide adenosyltransferase [Endomicrobium sp.]
LKVCFIQLFKRENFYGEQNILMKLENLDFFSFSKKHPYYLSRNADFKKFINLCDSAIEKLQELSEINSKKYDLIVLDEFNIAIRDKLIDENEFVKIIKMLLKKSNVIITGRGCPNVLINMADIVTEMKDVKHCYRHGVQAQIGIEY